jgi:GNAT superfamily N-acetyltransferase
MDGVVRAMEPRDIDAARRLLAQLSGYKMTADEMRDRLDYAHRSPIDWLFVCEVAGVVRGVLGFRLREQLERVGRYGEIYLIVADEAVRRQGVGRVMMAFAEQFAREHDCIGTWLVSGFKREAEAHKFYERLGYQTTGYRFVKMFE